jgi:membrane protein
MAERFTPRTLWAWLRDTVSDFIDDDAMAQAAAISFYAMLSMAPLLVIVVAAVGAVWGEEAARGEVVGQFGRLMGDEAAGAVEEMIQRAGEHPERGLLSSLIGLGVLIFAAIGVFGQLKAALNAVWEVRPRARPGLAGVLRAVRERVLSFAMVMTVAFLLVVSLAVSAGLSAVGGWMGDRVPMQAVLMQAVSTVVSIAVLAGLFGAMFRLLPDARVKWRDVWTGAIVTSVLFNLGKYLIGLYLGRAGTVSVYGAAGSLALILLWVYYSAIIFLLGAEFTQVHARWRGAAIEPAEGAVRAGACEAKGRETVRE